MNRFTHNQNFALQKQAGFGKLLKTVSGFIGDKAIRPVGYHIARHPGKYTLAGLGLGTGGAIAHKVLTTKPTPPDPYADAHKIDTTGWEKPTDWFNASEKSANAVSLHMLTKQAGLGTILRKGLWTDTVSGLFGRFGLGGMTRTMGRMMGGGADDAIQHGLTGKIYKIGDVLPDGTKITSWDDIGGMIKRLNDPAQEAAAKAGKFWDDATEGFRRISVTRDGKQTGILSGLGQRLMQGGDKLIRWADRTEDAYRKALTARYGKAGWGHKFARGAIGATSMGVPIGYTVAAEMAPENTWWAYPGKLAGKAFEYITPLGLASKGMAAAGEKLTDTVQNATMEGARFGAEMTAAELANTGRGAYLMGAITPGKLSREVSRQANEKIDNILMMQRMQQQA